MSRLQGWYDQMWRTFRQSQPTVELVLLRDEDEEYSEITLTPPTPAELEHQANQLETIAQSLAATFHLDAEATTDYRTTLDGGLRLMKRRSQLVPGLADSGKLKSTLSSLGWTATVYPANDLIWIQAEQGVHNLQLTVVDEVVTLEVLGPRHQYSEDLLHQLGAC